MLNVTENRCLPNDKVMWINLSAAAAIQ